MVENPQTPAPTASTNILITRKAGNNWWQKLVLSEIASGVTISSFRLRDSGSNPDPSWTTCTKYRRVSEGPWYCSNQIGRAWVAPLDVELTDSTGNVLIGYGVIDSTTEEDGVYNFGENFAVAANENASDTSQMIGYLILSGVGLIVIVFLSVGGAYWFKKRSKKSYAQREREEIEFASAITSGMPTGMTSGIGSGMGSGMPSGIATPPSVNGGTTDAKSTTKHPDGDNVDNEEVVYSVDDHDDNSGLIVNDSVNGKTQIHPLKIVAEVKNDDNGHGGNNDVDALAVIHGVRFEADKNDDDGKDEDVEDDAYAQFGYETENDDVTSINTGGHADVRIPAINVGIDETVTYYGPGTTPKPHSNTVRKIEGEKIGINMKSINELAAAANNDRGDK